MQAINSDLFPGRRSLPCSDNARGQGWYSCEKNSSRFMSRTWAAMKSRLNRLQSLLISLNWVVILLWVLARGHLKSGRLFLLIVLWIDSSRLTSTSLTYLEYCSLPSCSILWSASTTSPSIQSWVSRTTSSFAVFKNGLPIDLIAWHILLTCLWNFYLLFLARDYGKKAPQSGCSSPQTHQQSLPAHDRQSSIVSRQSGSRSGQLHHLFCSCAWSSGMAENGRLAFKNTQFFLNWSLITGGRSSCLWCVLVASESNSCN